MPSKKISQLPAAGAITGAETLEVVQSGASKKAPFTAFETYLHGSNTVSGDLDLASVTSGAASTLVRGKTYTGVVSADRTFSFNVSPAATNTLMTVVQVAVTGGPHVFTIPSSYIEGGDGLPTTVLLATDGDHIMSWYYDLSGRLMLQHTFDSPANAVITHTNGLTSVYSAAAATNAARGAALISALQALGANEHLRIGAGRHDVPGTFPVPDSATIEAAGKGRTIIYRTDASGDGFGSTTFVSYGATANIRIADMTIDCGYSRLIGTYPGGRFAAIEISGAYSCIERVHATDCGGVAETFPFKIANEDFVLAHAPHGARINDCSIDNCGPQVNAFNIANLAAIDSDGSTFAHSAVISNCYGTANLASASIGIGVFAGFDSGQIYGNTLVDFEAAMWQDTFPTRNIMVFGNHLINHHTAGTYQGMVLISNNIRNLKIFANVIQANAAGIDLSGPSGNDGNEIFGNTFLAVGGSNQWAIRLGAGGGTTNTSVHNNLIGIGLQMVDASTNAQYYDNYYTDGTVFGPGFARSDVARLSQQNVFTGTRQTIQTATTNPELAIKCTSSGLPILSMIGTDFGAFGFNHDLRMGSATDVGGAGFVEKFRFRTSGALVIGPDVGDPGAGNLLVSGLTPNLFIMTDEASVLRSRDLAWMLSSLGSNGGSPDNTTFLRGDGHWAIPPVPSDRFTFTNAITSHEGLKMQVDNIGSNQTVLDFQLQDIFDSNAYHHVLVLTPNGIAVRQNAAPSIVGVDINGGIIQTAGTYHNWGATGGTSGYGVRDLAGVMQFKNSGDSWNDLVKHDVQALSGFGAVGAASLATYTTTYESTDDDSNMTSTLAAGANGQIKILTLIDAGPGPWSAIITVTNLLGGTTITLDATGDTITLQYLGGKWTPISNIGADIA